MTLDPFQQFLFELHHPTPGIQWWNAWADMSKSPKARRWIAKQLKIDLAHPLAWFGLGIFAPMMIAGRWHIATPSSAPDFSSPEHIGVDPGQIAAVDPQADAAHIIGQNRTAIIGATEGDIITVRQSPLQWLRDWADERVIWLAKHKQDKASAHVISKHEPSPPTALLIGKPSKAAWDCIRARKVIAPPAIAPIIKREIFKAAHLPTIEAA